VTVLPQSLSDYPDIRADVCPNVTELKLGKYIDPLEIISVTWVKQTGADISSTGEVNVSGLKNMKLHTYKYTVAGTCVSGQERNFYLYTIKDKTVRPVIDTIVICWEKAEVLHLNQIFGIDAQGTWTYASILDTHYHIRTITTAPFSGAVIFNGKTAYEDSSIPFSLSYHVPSSKVIEFKYTSNPTSCLAGKEYTIVIVLTPDIN
jgi:hypothetical protein